MLQFEVAFYTLCDIWNEISLSCISILILLNSHESSFTLDDFLNCC